MKKLLIILCVLFLSFSIPISCFAEDDKKVEKKEETKKDKKEKKKDKDKNKNKKKNKEKKWWEPKKKKKKKSKAKKYIELYNKTFPDDQITDDMVSKGDMVYHATIDGRKATIISKEDISFYIQPERDDTVFNAEVKFTKSATDRDRFFEQAEPFVTVALKYYKCTVENTKEILGTLKQERLDKGYQHYDEDGFTGSYGTTLECKDGTKVDLDYYEEYRDESLVIYSITVKRPFW